MMIPHSTVRYTILAISGAVKTQNNYDFMFKHKTLTNPSSLHSHSELADQVSLSTE
jgi:hypothetical protein